MTAVVTGLQEMGIKRYLLKQKFSQPKLFWKKGLLSYMPGKDRSWAMQAKPPAAGQGGEGNLSARPDVDRLLLHTLCFGK